MLNFFKLLNPRIIKDPVHNFIHIDYQIIFDLLNSKEVQRLHQIKQLGGSFIVYPSAEHSRLSHSLGTYEIARRIIETVECVRTNLDEEEKILVLIAALLHDIGHGPFSHAFEKIHGISHEQYTINLILKDSEVNTILTKIAPDFAKKVAALIQKQHPKKLMNQLISSQLDADRMDYLLRDSFFSGITYGRFDIDWLLQTMKVHEGKIVFGESSISAIENFILGRYHMYKRLYYHPRSLNYEVILSKWVKRVGYLCSIGYKFKVDPTVLRPLFENRMLTNQEYLELTDNTLNYFIHIFENEEDPILSDLSRRFNKKILLRHLIVKNKSELELIKNKVSATFDPDYYFYFESLEHIHYKKRINGQDSILVLTKNDGIKDISDVSSIVKAITDKKTEEFIVFFRYND